MPSIRLMPYQVPAHESAECEISVLSPATEPAEVSGAWSPGTDITLRAEARVHPSFEREGGRHPLHLVIEVACPWTRWETAEVREIDRRGESEITVVVPGSLIANAIDARAHIVGNGNRLSTPDVHRAAKLWSGEPLRIPLSGRAGAFPTSAMSFSSVSGLRAIPWKLRISDFLEAGTHVSDGVRLLINTDFEVGRRLASGVESGAALEALQIDIILSMIEAVAALPEDEVKGVNVAEHPLSVTGVATKLARDIGLELDTATHFASKDPGRLRELAMSKVGFLTGDNG